MNDNPLFGDADLIKMFNQEYQLNVDYKILIRTPSVDKTFFYDSEAGKAIVFLKESTAEGDKFSIMAPGYIKMYFSDALNVMRGVSPAQGKIEDLSEEAPIEVSKEEFRFLIEKTKFLDGGQSRFSFS